MVGGHLQGCLEQQADRQVGVGRKGQVLRTGGSRAGSNGLAEPWGKGPLSC